MWSEKRDRKAGGGKPALGLFQCPCLRLEPVIQGLPAKVTQGARAVLAWEPSIALDEGLSRTIAYFERLLAERGGAKESPQ